MILKRCIEAALEGQRQENFECTLADTVGLERLWHIYNTKLLFGSVVYLCVVGLGGAREHGKRRYYSSDGEHAKWSQSPMNQ
jgi:hypothetical protein